PAGRAAGRPPRGPPPPGAARAQRGPGRGLPPPAGAAAHDDPGARVVEQAVRLQPRWRLGHLAHAGLPLPPPCPRARAAVPSVTRPPDPAEPPRAGTARPGPPGR